MIAAFGDPGHTFPAIALGRELARRGHEVCLETWSKWRSHVEDEGMEFAPAPVYEVWPGDGGLSLKPYQAAVRAAQETVETVAAFDPEVVVADILTIAAALAAEMDGRPWGTLIPHVLPTSEPGFPPYSIGARLPRTPVGATLWRSLDPLVRKGVDLGRDQLNEARRRGGPPPAPGAHGGSSPEGALVAALPPVADPPPPWGALVCG